MTHPISSTARIAARASLPFAALGLALLAAPAHADVAEGWGPVEEVNMLSALLVLVGVPILLFVLIALAVYVPALVRGEDVSPTGSGHEDQWLGGPRQDTKELTSSDSRLNETGGARGSW